MIRRRNVRAALARDVPGVSLCCAWRLELMVADCKFSHPASRPAPKGAKPAFGQPGIGIGGGMNISKKFGSAAEKKLDPTVGEFKPATPA